MEQHRPLPLPPGSIPMGSLIASSQSSLAISPWNTYRQSTYYNCSQYTVLWNPCIVYQHGLHSVWKLAAWCQQLILWYHIPVKPYISNSHKTPYDCMQVFISHWSTKNHWLVRCNWVQVIVYPHASEWPRTICSNYVRDILSRYVDMLTHSTKRKGR